MGQKLGTIISFKYIRAVVSGHGSKPEVLSMVCSSKLKPVWRDNIYPIKEGTDLLTYHIHISVCL